MAHRVNPTAVVPFVLTCLLATSGVAQQQDMRDVVIETVHVANGVYMLVGRGGNIGLSVGEDGPFVVDDQFAPLTEKIQAAIGEVTNVPVQFVLNTHWHGDHTGGNENFGKAGALIVAHQNVRVRLNPGELREVMSRSRQEPPEALPVITFTEEVGFYWNGEDIKAFHVPNAHTDGDAIVYFTRANVVHMGDIYFNGRYPFIDVESGGGIDGMIRAVEQVLQIANSTMRIIPGHGPLSNPEELRAYRDMLITVRDRVMTMRNDGLSVTEVIAAKPTSDLDDTWSGDAERFVRLAYEGLRGRW